MLSTLVWLFVTAVFLCSTLEIEIFQNSRHHPSQRMEKCCLKKCKQEGECLTCHSTVVFGPGWSRYDHSVPNCSISVIFLIRGRFWHGDFNDIRGACSVGGGDFAVSAYVGGAFWLEMQVYDCLHLTVVV